MKRFLLIVALLLALALFIPHLTSPSEAAFPSEWADYDVELARQWGLVNPYLLYYVSFTDMITKDIFCEMAVTLCEKLTHSVLPGDDSVVFEDDDWYIPEHFYQAYAAGIINGKGTTPDGKIILGKADALSREEVFKMLYNAIVFCVPGEAVGHDEIAGILSAFSDDGEISDWARESAAYMAKHAIVRGSDGKYLPKDRCTIEQGIVTIKRIYETFSSYEDRASSPLLQHDLAAPVFTTPLNGATLDIQDGVRLNWIPVEDAGSYRLRMLTEWGVLDVYIDKPSATVDAWALSIGTNLFTVTAVDESRRAISRSAYLTLYVTGDKELIVNVSSKNEADYFFDFNSKAEAELYMTTVSVKVWKLNSSGEKYTDTISIKVHRYVASDVISIFDEIYNGPEQFPIHSAMGFDWRDGWGEHPQGTAIDINPNENYQVFPDGSFVGGTLWAPGENPYSIPIGGDVERAFRNHGWGWGGVDWRSNNDYMHFSYFGR